MATYFHGGNPEIQSEGLHKLYLMNPNYIAAYNSASADTSQHHHHQQQQQPAASNQNMILPNSSLPHALQHSQFSHAPPSAQSQFLALPYAQAISADEPCRSGNSFYHDLWSGRGGQVEVCVSQPYQIQLGSSHVSPGTNQQGLSLSLSSQPRRGGGGNGNLYGNRGGGSTLSAVQVEVVGGEEESDKGVENFIMGSKYLKATQELLDEVVNVGKEAAMTTTATVNDHQLLNKEEKVVVQMESNINGGENNEAGGGGSVGAPNAAEQLSMAQRQEFQMKKTKLISMLDEVDQRYRQYHHQMNTVMSSFEQVAGHGSARSYTSLALKTISKQFRCLQDAIASQIKETSKSCEDDCLGVKGEGSPRLRMIDHQIRQHRALQHLGMMQHNAWRPQRGLPERAVSVLRAWLFEHFLHPYPKDSDKQMLAKQTGLARSQVSNWFINARVRLWKPMVEEMYLEEVKDHEEEEQKDSNNNGGNASTSKSTDLNYKQRSDTIGQPDPIAAPYDISNSSIISASPNSSAFQAPPPGFVLIGSSTCDMDGFLQYKSLKKPRGNEAQNSPSSILSMDMEMKAAGEMSFSRQQHHLNNNATARFSYTGHNGSIGGGFGPYFQLGELGRFNQDHQLTQSFHGNSNNGSVSLTLGLPPGENLSQTYFSGQNMHGARADDFCGINNNNNNSLQTSPRTNMGFQNMDIQNGKRHAAQLLPDFVA